ncbi:MAG: hypothetical protein ABSG59_01660 [Verrucomicrobiota bacterium]|jgi:hypothetical protein
MTFLPFANRGYLAMFALLLAGRGMDFLSTWVATPNLALEGNPLAKKMGWKWGGLLNVAICFAFAFWPLTAVIVITTSLLVAARNFHSAWLMRSMGEAAYREWFVERIAQARLSLFFSCLLAETVLGGAIGAALIGFSGEESVPFAIGFGILAYSAIVLFYTSLSLWRLRRRME